MSLSVRILDSVEDFQKISDPWNSLWERSDEALPTLRAEPLVLWQKQFASKSLFRTVLVESKGRILAGLPLIAEKKSSFFRTGILPSNDWTFSGDLLLDRSENPEATLDLMIESFRQLPFDLLWFDPIRFEHPQWTLFRDRLIAEKKKSQWLPRYQTAVFPVDRSREELAATWTKNEINNIRRRLKNAYPPNTWRFVVLTDPAEIAAQLPECFELENRGWKGEAGGSIGSQRKEPFFIDMAKLLASQNRFRLYLLILDEKIIAFQYNLFGKNTVFLQKTSFDPELKKLSPGQVLQLLTTEALIDEPEIERFDFAGIMAHHQAIWNPTPETVGQLVLPVSAWGNLVFTVYDTVMPWIRKRRARLSGDTVSGSD